MMKRFCFIVLLFSLASGVAWAGNDLKKYYRMQLREDSRLFFIMPYKIPCNNSKVPDAVFDVTYFTNQDSATINMTITNPQMLRADSICWSVKNVKYTAKKFQTFYIENGKSGWGHRYSCRVPYSVVYQCFVSSIPFTLTVFSKTTKLQYAQSEKSWKKHTELKQIIQIIESNKQ